MLNDSQPTTMAALTEQMEKLEAISHQLRDALMQRNNDAIWDAVASQEQVLEQLSALPNIPNMLRELPPEQTLRVRELASKTKINQRINRALTRAFMKIIDNTFNAVGDAQKHEPLTYSHAGNFPRTAPAALFVQQTG